MLDHLDDRMDPPDVIDGPGQHDGLQHQGQGDGPANPVGPPLAPLSIAIPAQNLTGHPVILGLGCLAGQQRLTGLVLLIKQSFLQILHRILHVVLIGILLPGVIRCHTASFLVRARPAPSAGPPSCANGRGSPRHRPPAPSCQSGQRSSPLRSPCPHGPLRTCPGWQSRPPGPG